MFYVLEENGYMSRALTEKMVAAVGFRNLVVHEYGRLDLEQVYHIAHHDIDNLKMFCKALVDKCAIA
jgi:uncharacterized protein YutE (UPF0331/DUF86 family)